MERRRKKTQKKKRRTKESKRKQAQKVQDEAKLARIENQTTTEFNRSAWQALEPSKNIPQQSSPKSVLSENQGFQISKWKPHEDSK